MFVCLDSTYWDGGVVAICVTKYKIASFPWMANIWPDVGVGKAEFGISATM